MSQGNQRRNVVSPMFFPRSVPRRRFVVAVATHDWHLLARDAAPLADPLAEVRSLQNGRYGEAGDHSTGRWQVGQATVFTLRCRWSA